jgi:hypothetical protein
VSLRDTVLGTLRAARRALAGESAARPLAPDPETGFAGAIIAEIGETILPRRLVFTGDDRRELAVEASGREVLRIGALWPEALRPPEFASLSGPDPLRHFERLHATAACLAAFAIGAGAIGVRIDPPEPDTRANEGGLSAEELLEQVRRRAKSEPGIFAPPPPADIAADAAPAPPPEPPVAPAPAAPPPPAPPPPAEDRSMTWAAPGAGPIAPSAPEPPPAPMPPPEEPLLDPEAGMLAALAPVLGPALRAFSAIDPSGDLETLLDDPLLDLETRLVKLARGLDEHESFLEAAIGGPKLVLFPPRAETPLSAVLAYLAEDNIRALAAFAPEGLIPVIRAYQAVAAARG